MLLMMKMMLLAHVGSATSGVHVRLQLVGCGDTWQRYVPLFLRHRTIGLERAG